MNGFIARFLSDERGATAIEYGLICGLIFVAILGGLNALGGGQRRPLQRRHAEDRGRPGTLTRSRSAIKPDRPPPPSTP